LIDCLLHQAVGATAVAILVVAVVTLLVVGGVLMTIPATTCRTVCIATRSIDAPRITFLLREGRTNLVERANVLSVKSISKTHTVATEILTAGQTIVLREQVTLVVEFSVTFFSRQLVDGIVAAFCRGAICIARL
jgi:hypothetical protein